MTSAARASAVGLLWKCVAIIACGLWLMWFFSGRRPSNPQAEEAELIRIVTEASPDTKEFREALVRLTNLNLQRRGVLARGGRDFQSSMGTVPAVGGAEDAAHASSPTPVPQPAAPAAAVARTAAEATSPSAPAAPPQPADGKTRLDCAYCDGKGYYICRGCNGRGQNPWFPPNADMSLEERKCTTCRGYPYTRCYKCNGTGKQFP